GFWMAFSRFPLWKTHETKINLAGYIVLFLLAFLRVEIWDLPFSVHKNDIIILVLQIWRSLVPLYGCLPVIIYISALQFLPYILQCVSPIQKQIPGIK
ncbi:MAG: hypothetical protein ACOC2E_09675, partial [Bacteroidota bacterium]